MKPTRPCPAHTPPAPRDLAYPASSVPRRIGPTKTVVVEFVEETRYRLRLQVPAELAADDIEAALPNIVAMSHDDGFIDLNRYIERVDILPGDAARAGAFPLDVA